MLSIVLQDHKSYKATRYPEYSLVMDIYKWTRIYVIEKQTDRQREGRKREEERERIS